MAVQYKMLRSMFLPGKATPDQVKFYEDMFRKVSETTEYKDYMEKQALKPVYMTGKERMDFLEKDDNANSDLMKAAGFVAK